MLFLSRDQIRPLSVFDNRPRTALFLAGHLDFQHSYHCSIIYAFVLFMCVDLVFKNIKVFCLLRKTFVVCWCPIVLKSVRVRIKQFHSLFKGYTSLSLIHATCCCVLNVRWSWTDDCPSVKFHLGDSFVTSQTLESECTLSHLIYSFFFVVYVWHFFCIFFFYPLVGRSFEEILLNHFTIAPFFLILSYLSYSGKVIHTQDSVILSTLR